MLYGFTAALSMLVTAAEGQPGKCSCLMLSRAVCLHSPKRNPRQSLTGVIPRLGDKYIDESGDPGLVLRSCSSAWVVPNIKIPTGSDLTWKVLYTVPVSLGPS